MTLSSKKEQLGLRRQMQPVFQNPYASLDPMYSIYRSIEEPLRTHKVGTDKEREARVRDLLDKVSLPSAVMRATPTSCPVVSVSASRSPGRWRCEPEVVISTRRSRRSTCWCRRRS